MDGSPRARFARWVEFLGSERAAARALNCDPSYPGKIIHQGRRPGLEVAHAIEARTAEPREDGVAWDEPRIRTEEWLHSEDGGGEHEKSMAPIVAAEGGQS